MGVKGRGLSGDKEGMGVLYRGKKTAEQRFQVAQDWDSSQWGPSSNKEDPTLGLGPGHSALTMCVPSSAMRGTGLTLRAPQLQLAPAVLTQDSLHSKR